MLPSNAILCWHPLSMYIDSLLRHTAGLHTVVICPVVLILDNAEHWSNSITIHHPLGTAQSTT